MSKKSNTVTSRMVTKVLEKNFPGEGWKFDNKETGQIWHGTTFHVLVTSEVVGKSEENGEDLYKTKYLRSDTGELVSCLEDLRRVFQF